MKWQKFVEHCENTLGVTYPDDLPIWRARGVATMVLKKKIATKPEYYTWDNLMLAVAYLRKQQMTVQHPVAVCWWVEAALEVAATPTPPRPLGELIDSALAVEQMQRLFGWQYWVGRLVRSMGNARQDTYDEWYAERWNILHNPARVCGNCSHARLGQTIHCSLFSRDVPDTQAEHCRSFDLTTARALRA